MHVCQTMAFFFGDDTLMPILPHNDTQTQMCRTRQPPRAPRKKFKKFWPTNDTQIDLYLPVIFTCLYLSITQILLWRIRHCCGHNIFGVPSCFQYKTLAIFKSVIKATLFQSMSVPVLHELPHTWRRLSGISPTHTVKHRSLCLPSFLKWVVPNRLGSLTDLLLEEHLWRLGTQALSFAFTITTTGTKQPWMSWERTGRGTSSRPARRRGSPDESSVWNNMWKGKEGLVLREEAPEGFSLSFYVSLFYYLVSVSIVSPSVSLFLSLCISLIYYLVSLTIVSLSVPSHSIPFFFIQSLPTPFVSREWQEKEA
jgi:hypothetical protein